LWPNSSHSTRMWFSPPSLQYVHNHIQRNVHKKWVSRLNHKTAKSVYYYTHINVYIYIYIYIYIWVYIYMCIYIYTVFSISQGGSHWVCLERYCFRDFWFICFCVTVHYLFKQLHFACIFFPSDWDKKVLGPSEISVLQRSQPDVLQILNVYGKTLIVNLLNINEFWLYGYILQESLRCNCSRYICTG
jgi:hypothetical protein